MTRAIPSSTRRRTTGINLLWGSLIVLAVLVTQVAAGSYDHDLTHGDEAAHFVTAMCVLDYVRTGVPARPVTFAEAYYAHYPKVAFGHWPPAFFVIQAFWYSIVGGTPHAGILLVGIIAAIGASLLFGRIRAFSGTWIAVACLAVYFSLPVVQRSSVLLMPDMLAAVLGFLAVLAFCDGCVTDRPWPWMASVFWTAAALLTKESALSILLLAPMAFFLPAGELRRAPSSKWYFWLAFSVIAVAVLAVYDATGVLRLRGLPAVAALSPIADRLAFLQVFFHLAPWPLLLVAGIGALSAFAGSFARDRGTTIIYMRGFALWLSIWLASQVFFRDVIEDRYFLPAVFPLLILFGEGLRRLAGWTERCLPGIASHRWAVPAIVSTAILALVPAVSLGQRTGYGEVAAALTNTGRGEAVLISSDSVGDGALIVEALVHDRERQTFVLRASKMLATSEWLGGHYRLLTSSAADVRALLDAIPIRFIALDSSGADDDTSKIHHLLLEQAVLGSPESFRLVANFPLQVADRSYPEGVRLYENLGARGRRPEIIRIPMQETLGRTLEVNAVEWRTVGAVSASAGTEFDAFLKRTARRLASVLPGRRGSFAVLP